MKRADGPKYPRYPIAILHPLGPIFRHLPLSLRRHLLYLRTYGRWGNFRRPRRVSEMTQWRIINDRRPILAFSQDKLAAKTYAQRELAHAKLSHLVRFPATLWVGTDVRELKEIAERLPARWVLKPNHSSGRFRVLDSSIEPLDWDDLITAGDRWMQRDEEARVFGHWAYGQARQLLIAEERVGNGSEPPLELKVHTNNGITAHYFWVDRSRPSAIYACFRADGSWFRWRPDSDPMNEDPGDLPILSQRAREELLAASHAVGAPFDKIRVDYLYDKGNIWFGELTPYQTAGLYPVSESNDLWHGESWTLPDLNAPDPREAEWRALLQGTPKGTLQS
ncbi:MAG: ATP-grasp fold amidoligase family protein [Candidatus Limnocylindrus sp.]